MLETDVLCFHRAVFIGLCTGLALFISVLSFTCKRVGACFSLELPYRCKGRILGTDCFPQ